MRWYFWTSDLEALTAWSGIPEWAFYDEMMVTDELLAEMRAAIARGDPPPTHGEYSHIAGPTLVGRALNWFGEEYPGIPGFSDDPDKPLVPKWLWTLVVILPVGYLALLAWKTLK